jgi:hypothetical protein
MDEQKPSDAAPLSNPRYSFRARFIVAEKLQACGCDKIVPGIGKTGLVAGKLDNSPTAKAADHGG